MSNVIFRHTMTLNSIDNKAKEFLLRLSKAKRGDLAANVTIGQLIITVRKGSFIIEK
jgi:hypothetical protein